jgi:hypothetical protein
MDVGMARHRYNMPEQIGVHSQVRVMSIWFFLFHSSHSIKSSCPLEEKRNVGAALSILAEGGSS